MKYKINIRGFICFLIFGTLTFPVKGQKHYVTPKHSLGIEISYSIGALETFSSNFRQPNEFPFPRYIRGNGGSILIPYQYSSKKSFMGFQSGLGLYMWGVGRIRNTRFENQGYYTLGVPILAQFKVSKSFWIESGSQVNIPVYNSLSEHPYPVEIPIAEIQALFGFRYNIYKSLAFRGRVHHGLTRAYQFTYPSNIEPGAPGATYRYRLFVAEIGLSYLFPLKK